MRSQIANFVQKTKHMNEIANKIQINIVNISTNIDESFNLVFFHHFNLQSNQLSKIK